MCVIAICDKTRPTAAMVTNMWNKNKDGAGIAWREKDKDGKTLVKWKKGLDLEATKELVAKTPFPFVVHFRLASIGGVSPELTHPFTIDDFENSLKLTGESKGDILFHNGHWNNWKDLLFQVSLRWKEKVPNGKWTDTRAMAWIARFLGIHYIHLLDAQKGVVFGPETLEIIVGTGWTKVEGVWCSNDYFVPATTPSTAVHIPGASHYRICRFGQCTKNNDLVDGYCQRHRGGVETASSAPVVCSFPPQKSAIERLREAEEEEKAIKSGTILKSDRKYSKNELKRLRRVVENVSITAAA